MTQRPVTILSLREQSLRMRLMNRMEHTLQQRLARMIKDRQRMFTVSNPKVQGKEKNA